MDVEATSDHIPDENHVLRNVHCAQYKKWKARRIPKETEFSLRIGEDGLSVIWEERCNLTRLFIIIGYSKNRKNTAFLNPEEFKVIRFNVGYLRNLTQSTDNKVDVIYNPRPENDAHSLVLYSDDEEIRIKLCELVEGQEAPLISIDYQIIQEELL